MPNRLARESSPYLRQHADNPVDWYPWGAEALERAAREDRPIVLSVGYSSCHWCHVMEHESFEDPAIAALMNRLFVNVKVDREDRPDIDQIYMKAVQAMTGQGGWPMTVFLTPDGTPFFGGTYFPPEPRPGMPSFAQVLTSVHDAWTNRRDQVEAGGGRLIELLAQTSTGAEGLYAGPDLVDAAVRTLASRYDPRHGGFGRAPKFPQPVTLELLLRHHARTGETAALEMVLHTLRRMAAGGLRDHLSGGFHRYSVDERWLVPHFEKMLYDNALLVSAFLDAWRLTGAADLAEVLEETLDYVVSDLRGPEGGFLAARDADSEGEEGLFYVWSSAEIDEVLGPDEAPLFRRVYDVSDAGNFEGRNILHLPHPIDAVADSEGIPRSDLRARLAHAREALRSRRAEREHPFRDEKVIVSWNGLTIRALAEAGAAFGRADWVAAAATAASFIQGTLRRDGRLLRSWIAGQASGPAFLEDHASLGNALLSLHAATLDPAWLEGALAECDTILEHFWDPEAGTVFDAPNDGEALVVRARDAMDNATPSGVSLAAELFARAGHLTGEARWREAARRIVDRETEALGRFGPAFGRLLSVLDRLNADPVEIVIAGGDDDPTRALVRAAHGEFLRGGVLSGIRDDHPPPDLPLLRDRGRIDGRAAAWVCRSLACRLPVTDPDALLADLRPVNPS
jgi:uncharacterized protein YyaL (SSP411 family)